MKEEWIAYVLKQTLQGLKYFHDQGQVGNHTSASADFSPHHVLLSSAAMLQDTSPVQCVHFDLLPLFFFSFLGCRPGCVCVWHGDNSPVVYR